MNSTVTKKEFHENFKIRFNQNLQYLFKRSQTNLRSCYNQSMPISVVILTQVIKKYLQIYRIQVCI